MLGRLFGKSRPAAPARGVPELLAEAFAHHQAGRLDEAEGGYRSLLAADPRNFDATHLLGVVALQRGRPQEALEHFLRARDVNPQSAIVCNSLGEACRHLGQADEAFSHLRRAAELDPGYAEAHFNLGGLLRQLGRKDEAIAAYGRAVDARPEFAAAHGALAVAWHDAGKLDEALAAGQRALALEPDSAPRHFAVGNLLREKGFLDEAADAYRAALEREPRLAEAHNNLGNVLRHRGRTADALASYEAALRAKPDFAEALLNAAQLLRENRRMADAVAAYRVLLEAHPAMAEAHLEMGHALKGMGDVQGSLACYRRALEIDPGYAEARWSMTMSRLPMVADSEAQQAQSRVAFSEDLAGLEQWCAEHGPGRAVLAVGSQQPFYLAYQEEDHRAPIARYGALCASLMGTWFAATGWPALTRVTRAQARIGIASAHIRDHSIWHAIIKGWLENIDRERFDVRVFHLGSANDIESARAKTLAAHYTYGNSTFAEWARTIHGHQLDMLIYPEIGIDPLTAKLAAMRLASVQATSWGHPHTSGLPTIDYYLSAAALEPPEGEAHYTERLVRLPGFGSPCAPAQVTPAAVDPAALGLRPGVPLLLCPGTPFKYTPRHDAVLVEIARQLGECQFAFFIPDPPELMQRVRARLARAFSAAGLDLGDFVVFLPWQNRAAFYGLMQEADVYLDTLGFSGYNTALQAIECGLPLVAYEGRFLRGRLASGILRHMGLDEMVARTDAEYVAGAVRLARDAGHWGAMQEALVSRRKMLYADVSSVRALEAFFERALSPA
jgi:predicted O-linked N-acetylglucosamine transferase (SPINDLY family)